MLILIFNGPLVSVTSAVTPPFAAGPYSRPGMFAQGIATDVPAINPVVTEVASFLTVAPERPTILVIGGGVSSTSFLVGGTATIQ